LLRCVCDPKHCLEKGKIVWGIEKGKYTHVRIDDCMEIPDTEKRCDCLIFFFPVHRSKNIVFIVEVKGRDYEFEEVQEKFCNSIRRIESLEDVRRKVAIIPVLYADRHKSDASRIAPHYKVSTTKGKIGMVLLNHGDDISKSLK